MAKKGAYMEEQDDLSAKADSLNGDTDNLKRLKRRSPNYPAIGLEKSLERAETLRTYARHHAVSVSTAYNLWKYKKGLGDQIIAALKSFSLLDVTGERESRQIRLTDTARRILGNAPDRGDLLKVAALSPPLHKEIWEKYEGDIPANPVLRDYLVWDRNFNEDAVDNFINQFRETISYAKLNISDKLRDYAEDDRDSEDENEDNKFDDQSNGTPMTDMEAANSARKLPPPPAGVKNFILHFMNQRQGILTIPAEMSSKEYELLKQQLNHNLALILATSVKTDNDTKSEPTPET